MSSLLLLRRLLRCSGVGIFRYTRQLTASVAMTCLLSGCGAGGGAYYCSAQKRVLTDEELIEIAVREQVAIGHIDIDGSEASIRDFHKEQPTCCSVTRNTEDQGFINWIVGFRAVDVEVNFRVRTDRRKAVGEYYEGHVIIRACGEVDRVYGTGVDALKQISNGVQ